MSKIDTSLPNEWIKAVDLKSGDCTLHKNSIRCVMSAYKRYGEEVPTINVVIQTEEGFEDLQYAWDTKVRRFDLRHNYQLLHGPLSTEEMLQAKDYWIRGIVQVDLGELTNSGFEYCLDLISIALTDTELLAETSWEIVGHRGNTLHLFVEGDARYILECEGILEEDE